MHGWGCSGCTGRVSRRNQAWVDGCIIDRSNWLLNIRFGTDRWGCGRVDVHCDGGSGIVNCNRGEFVACGG